MFIPHEGLVQLVEQGVVTDVDPASITGASIDVTLGDTIWIEDPGGGVVRLSRGPSMAKRDISGDGYRLMPGEFILAQTREQFFMPDDLAAEFRLKSSWARSGLDQSLAVWCHPGWTGSVLTLELRNNLLHHQLLLSPGMPIGQMVFWRSEPTERRYAGRYNHDTVATPSKA